MKEIPTTLKVDTIGRVMIPKHIRDEYAIVPGSLITIVILVQEKSENRSEGANPREATLSAPVAVPA